MKPLYPIPVIRFILAGILLPHCHLLAQTESDRQAFFESKIRPLLVERCYGCHSADKKQEGGLQLDVRQGWQKGGDSGPAIVPGNPELSLLIQRVTSDDKDLVMPPESAGPPLTAQQKKNLTDWVHGGAFDPREAAADSPAAQDWDSVFRDRLNWWSLRPIQAVEPPEVADPAWSQTSIDRLLRSAMEARGVQPAPLAEAATLLRRACLVLTGLPPTAEQTRAFQKAANEDFDRAYTALIDQLLSSPQYGERFARHWLDVVRFSETYGNEWNYDVPYAWRYRDYVIRALNSDVPFDRFVREHIAGDLLATPRRSPGVPFDESPLGTAFYRFGEVNHDSCTQFPVIGYDILDNQLDTVTKAFQASTAACARCHDHKLDAIAQRDYYALLAILRSSRPVMRTLDDSRVHYETTNRLKELKQEMRSELARLWRLEASSLNAAKLNEIADSHKDQTSLPLEHPLSPWLSVRNAEQENIAGLWSDLSTKLVAEAEARQKFNDTAFTTLADFRTEVPKDWYVDGLGLGNGVTASGDFCVSAEGDTAIKSLLPSGLMTFSESDRLNGALRSPTLRRSRAKISFEVMGGRFSLARLVFNNCQLNYDRQHSIHHDSWSWITIDWPEQTDQLAPYVELLTFWDNPKFPDPLGTLGKDIENQREPYEVHAKVPRSWWGLRRIVVHDDKETPRPSLAHMTRLLHLEQPQSQEDIASRYAKIAAQVVDQFAANRASDDDVLWLNWLLKTGILSNRGQASAHLTTLIKAYREIESTLSPPTTFPTVADEGQPMDQPLFVRGDLTKPRDAIPRGYLKMLAPEGLKISAASSGRSELAEAIASPDNPLTARVIVNRVWQWIFGRGQVGTPDDFGHLGERPLNPELLDYLAAQFIADGWSIKHLVRELVLTRTFQSASRPTASAASIDPQNHLFSFYAARRAEAEVVRDSLLAVSGRLDRQLYGPSVLPYRPTADNEKRLYAGPLDGHGRRSLYIKFQLMEQPAFLRAFNLPGGKLVEGRRGSIHTLEQSLAMLNDPLVLSLADDWSKRLLSDGATSVESRLESMFVEALARNPSPSELDRFRLALRQFASAESSDVLLLSSPEAWREVAHTLFNLKEFIFIP